MSEYAAGEKDSESSITGTLPGECSCGGVMRAGQESVRGYGLYDTPR